jgi:hypothetical protein
MTQRLTVSLPDDVAAWLASQGNASAAVASAVRREMVDESARQTKRRADARAYAEWMRTGPLPDDAELTALSNEISLRGTEW